LFWKLERGILFELWNSTVVIFGVKRQ